MKISIYNDKKNNASFSKISFSSSQLYFEKNRTILFRIFLHQNGSWDFFFETALFPIYLKFCVIS